MGDASGRLFRRQPGIPYGPFGARWGCVLLVRFVGGRHVNQGMLEPAPFRIDPAFAMVLPPEMMPYAAAFQPASGPLTHETPPRMCRSGVSIAFALT